MKLASVLAANVVPVYHYPTEAFEVLGVLLAEAIGYVEGVHQKIAAPRGLRLDEAVQDVDTGFVLVVRQVGVQRQGQGEVGEVLGAGLGLHHELLAVGGAPDEADPLGHPSHHPLVQGCAPEQGHPIDGQGLEPLLQHLVVVHHLVEVEVLGNRLELRACPVATGRAVEVGEILLLALLLKAPLPEPLNRKAALVAIAPAHDCLLGLYIRPNLEGANSGVEVVPVQFP